MRTRRTIAALSMLVTLAASGCAPLLLGLHWMEEPIGNGHYTDVTPLGELQARAKVETHPGDPAPDEVAPVAPEPAPPQPVIAPPAPLPPMPLPPMPPPPPPTLPLPPAAPPPTPDDELVGPPYGTQPLRFVCAIEQRASLERVVQHWAIWDIGEKLVMGVVGLFEATTAAAIFFTPDVLQAEQRLMLWPLAMLMAADAFGLATLIALTRPTWQSRSGEQEGVWRPIADRCPEGLVALVGARALPIDAAGRLELNDEAWLVRELVRGGGPLVLRVQQASTAIRIDPATRCRWAAGRRLPAPLSCAQLVDEPVPAQMVILPLIALPTAAAQPQ